MAVTCPLCAQDGGTVLLRTADWRLVRAVEAGFPAFYRVIWNAHVAEFSDLEPEQRGECMEIVVAVEQALRRRFPDAKINLAALGNVVPHLHWHVIARFPWDSHFPGAVWASAQREAPAERLAAVEAALPALERELVRHLAAR